MTQEQVDICTRGAVARHLVGLAKQGQIKECQHMRLDSGRWYEAKCEKDFADRIDATNVSLDRTGYGGPSSWWWPRCPKDCPFFTPVKDKPFLVSVSRDQYTEKEERNILRQVSDKVSPEVADMAPPELVHPSPLKHPERMTVPWLWHNASPSFWWTAIGALAAMFVLGVTSTRLSFVREFFGLATYSIPATSPPVSSNPSPPAVRPDTAK